MHVHIRSRNTKISRGHYRRRVRPSNLWKCNDPIPWGKPASNLYLLGKFSVVSLHDCEQSTISKGLVRKLREQMKVKSGNVSPGSLYLKLFNWDRADTFIFLNCCRQVWLPVVMAWIMFMFWKDGLFHLPFLLAPNMQLRSETSPSYTPGNFLLQTKLDFWAKLSYELVTN